MAAAGVVFTEIPKSAEGGDDLLLSRYRMLDFSTVDGFMDGVGGVVDLGNIVEPPVIQTSTSIAPLGWTGIPGNNHAEPLKVDIIGHGLHLCTLVQAQVNGNWYVCI
ncbi:hypothetical protein J5N97_001676 [Dioscorea zingiberensis]|uniref:Uncharacterized protein n=1 Tax=Dioscorea zingiberensis TaxID=325984 RepID=A0A9D5BTX5_9LILI|nr:hypothetical protein J5N97_001676 [Dioscorea zingiberensis]